MLFKLVFREKLFWYIDNLNAFNGKCFVEWNALEKIKESLYERLSKEVDLYVCENKREQNVGPLRSEVVLSHFKRKEIRKDMLSKFEPDMNNISFAKVSNSIYYMFFFKIHYMALKLILDNKRLHMTLLIC